jgi:sensor histidine kinase YesM
MRNQWYNSRWAVISFHILAWFLVFLLPLLAPANSHEQNIDWYHALFNKRHILFHLSSASIFYLNAYFFIPFYLNKRKKWQYITLLVITCFAFMVLSTYLFQDKNHASGTGLHRESFFLIIPFLFLWSMSTLFRFSSDRAKTDQLLKEKENENLKTELLFLRSQVSPHFLFNVLNNMVALARLKSDRLEPSLIKLSGLMRYMLYESDEEKVPLAREIEYVTSYIDLQRLRFGKDMMINVRMDGTGDYQLIEPMLLIPFIENAFKHGTGLISEPEIDICLKTDHDMLDFRVKNKYSEEANEIKDRTSGIGLANVMRRLNLLYDKRYNLAINKQDGWFITSLQLKLQ